jgi:hypothetical protein
MAPTKRTQPSSELVAYTAPSFAQLQSPLDLELPLPAELLVVELKGLTQSEIRKLRNKLEAVHTIEEWVQAFGRTPVAVRAAMSVQLTNTQANIVSADAKARGYSDCTVHSSDTKSWLFVTRPMLPLAGIPDSMRIELAQPGEPGSFNALQGHRAHHVLRPAQVMVRSMWDWLSHLGSMYMQVQWIAEACVREEAYQRSAAQRQADELAADEAAAQLEKQRRQQAARETRKRKQEMQNIARQAAEERVRQAKEELELKVEQVATELRKQLPVKHPRARGHSYPELFDFFLANGAENPALKPLTLLNMFLESLKQKAIAECEKLGGNQAPWKEYERYRDLYKSLDPGTRSRYRTDAFEKLGIPKPKPKPNQKGS